MPVAALEKLKQKYPQYQRYGDEVLAERLAAKYPAYADLPQQVKQSRLAEEPNPFIAADQRTQAKIASRQTPAQSFGPALVDRLMQLRQDPLRSLAKRAGPLGIVEQAKDVMTVLPALTSTAESTLAEAGLAAQRGQPAGIFPGMKRGLTGQSSAQLGDIIRASGLPEPVAEVAAPVIGTLATMLPIGRPVGRGAEAATRVGKTGIANLTETFTAGSPKQAPIIASRIRDAFAKTKLSAGEQFGKQLDTVARKFPERRVSLRNMIDRLNEVRAESPKLSADLMGGVRKSGNRLLKDLLDNPELADDLTVVQAQEIKKTLQKAPSLASKSGKFGAQFSDTDLDLIEAVNDTRSAMLESFPELAKVFSKYGETMNKFKLLKNRFKVGSLLGNIEKEFGDKELMQMVQELLPPEAMQDMRLLQRSVKARGLAKGAAIGGAGTLGAAGLLKLLFGKP